MKNYFAAVIAKWIAGYFERSTRKKEEEIEVSEGKILLKLPFKYFWLGLIEAVIVGALMIGLKLENDLPISLAITCILTIVPGLLMMIIPLSGGWEVLVDQDDITVTIFFVFKKKFLFSEITHCKHTRGGWKFYIKDQKRKAFFVDQYMYGAGPFLKRIEAANIPVEEMIPDN